MPLQKPVLVKLGLDDKEYNARLKAATKKLRRSVNEMTREGRRLSITSREIFVGLTLPMGFLAKNIFDATAQLEKMHLGLSTIARSRGITAIDRLIEGTERLAKLPGLGLGETFAGVQQLIAVGASGATALKTVEGLGIGIARAGGSAQNFERVMRQVTQALSKGKLQMQDFRTIFEQMPEGRRVLEEAFGPGMSDLERLRAAGIPASEVITKMADGFRNLGAEGFMNTIANQTENLKDSWLLLRATVGKELFPSTIQDTMAKLSGIMHKLTVAIRQLDEPTRNSIVAFTKLAATIALVLPAAAFLVSRVKLMGALFLRYSTVVRTAVTATALMRPALLNAAAGYRGMSVAALAAARATGAMTVATRVLGVAIKKVIPFLLELYLLFEAVRLFVPDLNTKIKNLATKGIQLLGQQAIATIPALAALVHTVDALGSTAKRTRQDAKGLWRDVLSAPDSGITDWEKFFAGFNAGMDDFIKGLDDGAGKAKDLEKEMKKLSDTMKQRFDIEFGFAASDPLPNMSSLEQAAALFQGTDRSGAFVIPQVLDGMARALSNMPEDRLEAVKDFLARITDPERIAALNQVKEEFDAIGNAVANTLGSGLDGVLNALNQIPDGLDAVGKAMGKAVKQMLIDLAKLIIKLGIAALLVSILFPGAGGLGALLGGKGGFAAGGSFAGKGGFLKQLLGFQHGGVVPGPPSLGDSVIAALTPGEMVLNKDQQAALSRSMGTQRIQLSGHFRISGRDLVYIVDENAKMINGSR